MSNSVNVNTEAKANIMKTVKIKFKLSKKICFSNTVKPEYNNHPLGTYETGRCSFFKSGPYYISSNTIILAGFKPIVVDK